MDTLRYIIIYRQKSIKASILTCKHIYTFFILKLQFENIK